MKLTNNNIYILFKIIIFVLIIMPPFISNADAHVLNCSGIMEEVYKEYKEQEKDEDSAMYVVLSDAGCEYGVAFGESVEKAKKRAFKKCEEYRKDANYPGKCEPFAINDEIVWENFSENISFATSRRRSGIDEEKYSGDSEYRIKSSDKNLIKFNEQHKLTYVNSDDDIEGRFLYDQEDVTDDYQLHVIYILASDSEDKQYDVKGVMEDVVLTGNEYLKNKTDNQQFRLDLTKDGKLDVSFIRVDKTKEEIHETKAAADYFSAEAVMRGFYHPKKLYSIFYQDSYVDEWGQLGGVDYYGKNGITQILMGVTYLGDNPVDEGFHPHVHELIHALGFVQLCAPGAIIEDNHWGKNDHLGYGDDLMSQAKTTLGYMDRHVDGKRKEYYGHSNPNCELDFKKSAFLEPTEKDFQLPPRTKSCGRSIWQEKYNHELALDCLTRLNF